MFTTLSSYSRYNTFRSAIIGVIITLACCSVTTQHVYASAIQFPQDNITVEIGDTVAIDVGVDPEDTALYTAKVQLIFPVDIVQAEQFTFQGGWMVVSQAGYDVLDNTTGVVTKTAGYPNGFSQPKNLGKLVFRATKVGTGVVSVQNGSLLLDDTGNDMLNTRDTVSITVVDHPKKETPRPTVPPKSSQATLPSVQPLQSIPPSIQPTILPTLTPEPSPASTMPAVVGQVSLPFPTPSSLPTPTPESNNMQYAASLIMEDSSPLDYLVIIFIPAALAGLGGWWLLLGRNRAEDEKKQQRKRV